MIYSGIDLHKTNMVITTIDSNGVELAHAKLPCRKAEVSGYFGKFNRPHRAVVESTGSWYWLSDLLSTLGVELILAHALQLKAISYAKVKTDAVDAGMLAELLRVGLIPEAHQISPAMRSLREVMRTRLRLVVRRTAARVQVHCLAEKAGWQLMGREFEDINLLEEQMEALLGDGPKQASCCWLDHIRLLEGQITRLEGWLHERLVPDEQIQRLREVPGIGVIGAYTILTETDDMKRFPTPGQYLSYSRLVPGAANSGGKSRHRNSKQGNRYLKAIYTEAAVRAVQWYPVVREFYNKKTRRSGKRIARAIVAKELAKIVWHMLYYDQSYQGFKGRPTRAKTPQWPRPASP
jgi:transposase